MTTCPSCANAVDPLRSRFVGVRDGKIVAYCSAECAAGSPRARVERAMSPAAGVPVRVPTPPAGVLSPGGPPDGLAGGPMDSGPVIEILHEPASGVVTSAPDRRVEPRARHPDEIPIAAFWAADKAEKAERAEKERSAAVRQGAAAADAAGASRRNLREGAGRDSAESFAGQGAAAADAAGASRRNLRESTGRDSAESSAGQGPLAADAAGASRRDLREGAGRDSAEAPEGPGVPVADAAGASRRNLRESTGGDSAESFAGQSAAAADAVGASRRNLRESTGGDSAESFAGQGPLAVGVAGASRHDLREGAGRDSAEAPEGPGVPVADAAVASRRNLRESTGRDSAESFAGQGAAKQREADGGAHVARRGPSARTGAAALDPTGTSLRRRSRWPVVILILVLLGAGGGLLYHFFGRLSGGAGHDGHAVGVSRGAPPATAAAPAARAELSRPIRPPQVAAPPVVDLAAAVELARTALRRDLAATSPRVQRLAAAALARTQDAEACELLAAQLGLGIAGAPMVHAGAGADELASNDIARLDLAYALARGGDRRGVEVLARALGAPRGEARDEAAGLLAVLGDKRAVSHLLDLLAVEQRRLGAAEHLARLAEPRALQVLDHVRGDPRASADAKARATVALGIAGRSAVADALREMLGDPHFNAFAAAALAAQGDRAARPVLERQLASPPLRVLAARALRRLDPAIDPRPLLPPLLDVVRAGRDIDRIPAAEAVLLLAGPASWSAYD